MNRKSIFDAVRRMLGRGFKPPEISALDAAIDEAFAAASEQLAREAGDIPEWISLATPLVERFEGMHKLIPGDKVQAYPDPASGGAPWTIGIGTTRDEQGKPIRPGDVWTVERARKHFERELEEYSGAVLAALGGAKTSPHQMAALVAWAYNVGVGAVARSTLLRRHLAGDYEGAEREFARWNKAANKVMRGLTRRREAEAALYRKGSVT